MKRNLLITALLCSSGLYASAHSSAPIPAPAGQTEAVAADYEYTGEMSINMSTGHFTAFSANKSYASTWQNYKGWSNVPVVRLISFSNKKAQNNMDVAGSNVTTIVAHRGSVDSEYALVVEKGYVITGVSFDFAIASGSSAVTVTPIGGTAVKSTAEGQHVEVKGLSADTVVAFKLSGENKAIALTNLKVTYGKVKPAFASGQLAINTSTGTLNGTSGYCSAWTSTQKSPQIKLDCGARNISVANSTDSIMQCYRGSQSDSKYTLTAQSGWVITGYSFDFTATDPAKPCGVTGPDGKKLTSSSAVQHIKATGLYDKSVVAFAMNDANHAINVSNFVVTWETDSAANTELPGYTVFDNSGAVPYRIPAIGTAANGDLVAVADYRYSKADIGSGRVDLHLRISQDNGQSWGEIMMPDNFKGDGQMTTWRHDKAAYGDPCIVGDRESSRMMIVSCSGFPGFFSKDEKHLGWARWYSDDNGQTWTGPEYIDMKYIYEPLAAAGTPVNGFFVGSGKIHQSRYIKKDKYYRLYCVGSTQENGGNKKNWVLYSDDFGESWDFLGGLKHAPIVNTADEPKAEELPDGSVLLSSRDVNGRYYNIYTFSGNDGISGSWGEKALSSSANKGLIANNGCNGEVQVVPVVRKADGVKTFIALQSLPTSGRKYVSIFYKDLTDKETYASPANFAKNWDGRYVVSNTSSAYSTWSWQKDNALAFIYEEGGGNGGYDIVYKRIDIPTLTGGKYDFDATRTFERQQIDWTLANRIKKMGALIDSIKPAVEANTKYIFGDKLITDASQLECKFGYSGGTAGKGDNQPISNLIDGNAATYFHTDYSKGNLKNGVHWFDVTAPAEGKFANTIVVNVTQRKGANADFVKEFTISGFNSEAKNDSVYIAKVTVPNVAAGQQSTMQFTIPEGASYKYLRFNVTATSNNRGYWHLAEFMLSKPDSLDANSPNVLHPDAYATMKDAIAAAEAAKQQATDNDIAALEEAYDAYLRALQGTATGIIATPAVKPGKATIYYDLMGRRVANPVKGVFITNTGKRVIK